jgi:hypothetical protein
MILYNTCNFLWLSDVGMLIILSHLLILNHSNRHNVDWLLFSISVIFCAYLALKVKVISHVCKPLAVYTSRIMWVFKVFAQVELSISFFLYITLVTGQYLHLYESVGFGRSIDPSRWVQYVSPKRRDPFTPWRSVISCKNWLLTMCFPSNTWLNLLQYI